MERPKSRYKRDLMAAAVCRGYNRARAEEDRTRRMRIKKLRLEEKAKRRAGAL